MCCVKLQIPNIQNPKEAPIFKLQPVTSHVFGGLELEFLRCLGFGAHGRSSLERSDSRNGSPCDASRCSSFSGQSQSQHAHGSRNSDIRRNSRLRNSKSPAVAF